MSKAEEFISDKEHEVRTLFRDWHIEKLASVLDEYADEQFKNRVNAISDEQIEIEFRYDNTNDSVIGAKWLKEQLLKQ